MYSFFQWCQDNQRHDLLSRWDYEKNGLNPSDVSYGSTKKYYFACSRNIHESQKYSPNWVTTHKGNSLCDKCSSIAQWGIDNLGSSFLEQYWDYDKNIGIDPWKLSKGSHKPIIYIKCQEIDYHGSYPILAYSFVYGKRCGYCGNFKVHQNDSFARYHINNNLNFLKEYWSNKNTTDPFKLSIYSKKKVWIKCQETSYHDDYLISCNHFSNGVRCPSCANLSVHKLDSLGTKIPKSLNLWSDLNKKSPYDFFPKSDKKAYWKCENNIHEDYLRSIGCEVRYDFRCPECVKERDQSFLQEKVSNYISENYNYTINYEFNCNIIPRNPKNNRPMPFDNEVVELKLIIEVHGEQHYKTSAYSSIWKGKFGNPEDRLRQCKLHDRYKKYIAYRNGFSYLVIPFWTEKDESYKKLIDDKISEILSIQDCG
jgi:hypothetical protein